MTTIATYRFGRAQNGALTILTLPALFLGLAASAAEPSRLEVESDNDDGASEVLSVYSARRLDFQLYAA